MNEHAKYIQAAALGPIRGPSRSLANIIFVFPILSWCNKLQASWHKYSGPLAYSFLDLPEIAKPADARVMVRAEGGRVAMLQYFTLRLHWAGSHWKQILLGCFRSYSGGVLKHEEAMAHSTEIFHLQFPRFPGGHYLTQKGIWSDSGSTDAVPRD